MKTINFKYTLTEEQISAIAKGFGYSDTITNINPETNEWIEVANTQSEQEYAIEQVSAFIETKIKQIFMADTERQIQEALKLQKDEAENLINNTIASQRTITVE